LDGFQIELAAQRCGALTLCAQPSAERVAKRTCIYVPQYPQPVFDAALAQCKSSGDWRTFEIFDSGHDAMIDRGSKITELILAAA
jgi:hypothetical protein